MRIKHDLNKKYKLQMGDTKEYVDKWQMYHIPKRNLNIMKVSILHT